ncbi:MAG: putative sulfate exporter family transporter [Acidobacteriota bacterium]|nr:putative sulfate exporter family transporter [Acidobacteriota bacterium]
MSDSELRLDGRCGSADAEEVMQNLFYLGMMIAASGWLSPPLALVLGLGFGLLAVPVPHAEARSLAKFLLQAAVVCLGFGMNLGQVLRAGRSGFGYTILSITLALGLGLLLGRILKVQRTQSLLIAIGTAICGGSAIAAMGPVLEANDEEMAVSLGTVFVLNSVALLLFPVVGWHMHLSQTQFGLWAALAIHDTSSVVGAGARYGATALAVGTTVKLVRALWIVPLAVAVAAARGSRAAAGHKVRITVPWFILYFALAALVASEVPHWLPGLVPVLGLVTRAGHAGLTVVLFLIGTGITRPTLRKVGVRPMLQGVLLWVAVAGVALWAIRAGWIAL